MNKEKGDNMNKEKYNFTDLLDIMNLLRQENGCPWDREQTHETLKKYLLEETYEVLDAIDKENPQDLCEELGDLFFQVIFHSQIAKENNHFDIHDVIDGISKKMVSRHVHVFGDVKCKTANDVLDRWEKLKKSEKGNPTQTSVLKNVPTNLPALIRAYKVQQKASHVGFDWDNLDDVFDKMHEEIDELRVECKNGRISKIISELGDVMFALVNLGRFLDIHPEFALTGTTEKFINRFEYVENKATENGQKLEEMTLSEMDVLWNEAKKNLKEGK